MAAHSFLSKQGQGRVYDPKKTIVLIGFRGIGKSTLGLIASTHLDRGFIDADRLLSRTAGCSPNEYVARHSWEKFRDLETEILRRILEEYKEGYVVACGGGVVEREENRQMLKEWGRAVVNENGETSEGGGIVIHVTREKEPVIKYLVNEKDRPQWGEEIRSVWARRFPLFEECSTHTYVSLTAGKETVNHIKRPPSLILKDLEMDFMRFIYLLISDKRHSPRPPLLWKTGAASQPVDTDNVTAFHRIPLDRRSYTVTIDHPNPQDFFKLNDHTLFDSILNGVDAIEVRIDSLQRSLPTQTSKPFRLPSRQQSLSAYVSPSTTPITVNPGCPDFSLVAFNLAHIRKLSCSSPTTSPMPIIYSLKTLKQNGKFYYEHSDSNSTRQNYLDLALNAYKFGCEFLELELGLDDNLLRDIIRLKPSYTKVIVSHYDFMNQYRWDSERTMVELYQRAVRLGADIVKIGLIANDLNDNVKLHQFLSFIDSKIKEQRDLVQEDHGTLTYVPLIALNLGKLGKMFSLFNHFMTPLVHPLLPNIENPGTSLVHSSQSTFANIQKALLATGLCANKRVVYARERGLNGHLDILDHRSILQRGFAALSLPIVIEHEGDNNGLSLHDEDFGGAVASLDLAQLKKGDGENGQAFQGMESLPEGIFDESIRWTKCIDVIAPQHHPSSFLTSIATPPSTASGPPPLPVYHNIHSQAMSQVISSSLSPINAITHLSIAFLLGCRGPRGREAFYSLLNLGVKNVYCWNCDEDIGTPLNLNARHSPMNSENPEIDDVQNGMEVDGLVNGHDQPLKVIHLESLSQMPRKRLPTIIISFSSNLTFPSDQVSSTRGDLTPDQPVSSALSFPIADLVSALFVSPTGGTLLELDSSQHNPVHPHDKTSQDTSPSLPPRSLSISSRTVLERLLDESKCKDGWVTVDYKDVEVATVKKEFEVISGGWRLPLEALSV